MKIVLKLEYNSDEEILNIYPGISDFQFYDNKYTYYGYNEIPWQAESKINSIKSMRKLKYVRQIDNKEKEIYELTKHLKQDIQNLVDLIYED